jgi:hypothetical protein
LRVSSTRRPRTNLFCRIWRSVKEPTAFFTRPFVARSRVKSCSATIRLSAVIRASISLKPQLEFFLIPRTCSSVCFHIARCAMFLHGFRTADSAAPVDPESTATIDTASRSATSALAVFLTHIFSVPHK